MSDQGKNESIIAELTRAYWMELETVLNYLANSINLDGVRAEEIKKSLAADVVAELQHIGAGEGHGRIVTRRRGLAHKKRRASRLDSGTPHHSAWPDDTPATGRGKGDAEARVDNDSRHLAVQF